MKRRSKSELSHPASKYGSDKQYREWLSYLPSALDGSFTQYQDGIGRSIACHVRRVSRGAGTGIKPPYSCIPLTDEQHKLAHQHGDEYLMPLERWEYLADHYLKLWCNERAPYLIKKELK